MADALASGASGGNPVEVQVLSAAPNLNSGEKVSLMSNYELFKNYLENSKIHYGEGNLEHGSKYFRIPERLENDLVVDVLVIFSEHSVKVLIIGIATIEDEEKKLACYKLFNDFAARYSFFKFYLREDGGVNAEGDATLSVVKGEFQPDVLMGFVSTGLDFVQDVHKYIIKIQQA